MSDRKPDPELEDAMDSIRSIGEDWESRDHLPDAATEERTPTGEQEEDSDG